VEGETATREPARALLALDALTHRLRRECPWDREQDERSIVPHTVEEAYELADAAHRGDDAKLLDELGDVLFQVLFLALLLEERGTGDLAQVAEHCRQKLIRRHPHVFADTEISDAAEVLRNWDAIKATEAGREPGVFGEVPDNLPALLYARKVQRRAASSGLHPSTADSGPRGSSTAAPRDGVEGPVRAPQDTEREDQESFHAIGERLFALVDEARLAHVDPELALRAAAQRFRKTIEAPQGER
jgi:MazG family protein